MSRDITLLELVTIVCRHARSEDDVIASVIYLVNSGTVRLCGNFKGSRFPDEPPAAVELHATAPDQP